MSRVSVAGPIRWKDGSQIPGDGPMFSVWLAAVGACKIDECGLDMELPPMQLRKKNANQNAARHMCRQYRAGIEATVRQALPIRARGWSGWNSGTTDASTIDSCHVTIDSVGDSFGMHSPSFFGIAFEVAGRKSAWKDDGTDGAETLEAEDRRIWDDNLPLLYLGFSWL